MKKVKNKTYKKYSLTCYILKLIGESIVTVCMEDSYMVPEVSYPYIRVFSLFCKKNKKWDWIPES